MPSLGDIVNTITIRGVADGVDATTAATKGLKDAFDAASTAAKSSAGEISGAFDGIQKSIGAAGAGAAGGGGLSFLASVGIGAAASAAGLGVFLDWVQKTNKALSDMGAAAQQANLNLHDFQTLQFAAGASGVSSDTFAKSSAEMAKNLDEASRKENDLSKLLDANNIKFKDGNKLIIDMNGLWDISRDLISRAASEQQKIKMADMIGAGKELVPLLSEGAAAFTATRSEAEKLGLVINDEVIARAKTFEDEWTKSSLVFSTWMKAQLASLIPTIDDLIAKAQGLSSAVSSAVSGAINRSPADSGQTSRESEATAILSLIKANDDLEVIMDAVLKAGQALTGTLDASTKALVDNSIAGTGAAKMWDDIAAGMENAAAAGARIVNVPMPPTRPASKLPGEDSNDGGRDLFDKATASIEKHIGALAADSLSMGQNAGVVAGMKAEFQLLDAAKTADKDATVAQNAAWDKQIAAYTDLRGHMTSKQALDASGIELTDKQTAAFLRLPAAIDVSTQSYEKLKIAQEISRGQQTAFLTPEDVQIANQLKTIYPDVATALGSAEANALRLNKTFSDLSTLGQNSLSGFAVDFKNQLVSGASAWKAFETAGASALNKISDKLMQMAIDNLWSKAFGGAGATGLGGLLGMFGLGGASANLASSNAAATGASAGDVAYAFKSGGMVGIDGTPTYVHLAYFENAPRFASGGMITDGGVPIIAHPGERILNRQQTAAYNGGAGSSHIAISVSVDVSGANGDQAVNDIAEAAASRGVSAALKQVPSLAVNSIVNATNRGLRLHA